MQHGRTAAALSPLRDLAVIGLGVLPVVELAHLTLFHRNSFVTCGLLVAAPRLIVLCFRLLQYL
jgi:hypothetical protein